MWVITYECEFTWVWVHRLRKYSWASTRVFAYSADLWLHYLLRGCSPVLVKLHCIIWMCYMSSKAWFCGRQSLAITVGTTPSCFTTLFWLCETAVSILEVLVWVCLRQFQPTLALVTLWNWSIFSFTSCPLFSKVLEKSGIVSLYPILEKSGTLLYSVPYHIEPRENVMMLRKPIIVISNIRL